VVAQPGIEFLELHATGFVELDQKRVCGSIVEFDTNAIHSQECSGHRDSDSLVAIDEGVILREAFPKGGSLFDQVSIVSGLRARQCRLQSIQVAESV